MNQATFNITNDKIKLVLDERLSPEKYAEAKRCNFVWYPGQKLFCAKWSTQAEDFALSLVDQIDEDDVPDNVEERVNRFAKYAEQAESAADSSQEYLDTKANTERRKRNAINSIDKNLDKAAHYNRRIEAAIGHALYKDKPAVIARRIEGLEKIVRKMTKTVELNNACVSNWNTVNKYKDDEVKFKANALYVSSRSSCTPYGIYSGLTDGKMTPAEAVEKSIAHCENAIEWATRWINHTNDRLTYEKAMLEAAGGTISSKMQFQVGGAIKYWVSDNYLEIIKVNKKTVTVSNPLQKWISKVNYTKILEYLTPEQFAPHKERIQSVAEYNASLKA